MERDAEIGVKSPSLRTITPVKYPTTSTTRYHDKWYAIIFYAQLIMFLSLSVYCIIEGRISLAEETKNAVHSITRKLAWQTGNVFITSLITTCIYHFLIRALPNFIIHFSTWALFIQATIFALLTGFYIQITVGILYGLLTLIVPIVYFRNLCYIPISAQVLHFVSLTAHHKTKLILLLFIASLMANGYAAIATLAFNGISYMAPVSAALFIGNLAGILFFSIYWTGNVAFNVIRTIVAGTYAQSYDETPEVLADKHGRTREMVKRALGRGFGSICKGSTLLFIINTIYSIIDLIHSWSPVTNEAMEDVLIWAKKVVRNWNYSAFTHIALYLPSFRKASNATWDRVALTGVGKLMGDLYIGWFLFFLSLGIGFFSAFIDLILKLSAFNSDGKQTMSGLFQPLPFWGSIVLGMVVPQLYFIIIESGVTATFVCYADDPRALNKSDPILREMIKANYPTINQKPKNDTPTRVEEPQQ